MVIDPEPTAITAASAVAIDVLVDLMAAIDCRIIPETTLQYRESDRDTRT